MFNQYMSIVVLSVLFACVSGVPLFPLFNGGGAGAFGVGEAGAGPFGSSAYGAAGAGAGSGGWGGMMNPMWAFHGGFGHMPFHMPF